MQVNVRNEQREHCRKPFSLSWQGEDGITRSVQGKGIDVSRSGVGMHCGIELRPGLAVYIQDQENLLAGYGVVRHCTACDDGYHIGVELDEAVKQTAAPETQNFPDYYEFLQISPKAEPETIQRVYRFLAGRFHPDNPETGDPEKFLQLNRAFEVLSDRERRALYDATLEGRAQPLPAFESVDFMDGVEGEVNRRLAVLSLLYRRCRANVENPKVTLAELETMMGFPREYLDFTTWYLRSKKYITREDNSDFALTVLGVDYVESNYSKLPILRKLLTSAVSERRSPVADMESEASEHPGQVFIVGRDDSTSGTSR